MYFRFTLGIFFSFFLSNTVLLDPRQSFQILIPVKNTSIYISFSSNRLNFFPQCNMLRIACISMLFCQLFIDIMEILIPEFSREAFMILFSFQKEDFNFISQYISQESISLYMSIFIMLLAELKSPQNINFPNLNGNVSKDISKYFIHSLNSPSANIY